MSNVTMSQIAEVAGVSQATVSFVLNGRERARGSISPETAKRVQETAQKLGYNRDLNSGALQMAAKRHGLRILNDVIAVCSSPHPTPMHQQPFSSEILDGIENAAEEHGIDVLQCRLRSKRLPRLLEKREVDGIIMLTSQMNEVRALQRLNLPIIKLGSSSPAVHSVSAAHFEGAFLATSHLISQGHQHIAFIGYDLGLSENVSGLFDANKQRLAGFQAAMQKAKLSLQFVDCSLLEQSPEEISRSFKKLWRQSGGKITAAVCYNDIFATGVVQAVREMGLMVPKDVSVVGFDAASARFGFEPFISSVGYDRLLMGKRAVEILMQAREEESGIADASRRKKKFIQDELPVYFVEGATTAPPAK